MTYITDKTEQAIFINENGCSDLNCLTCKFITGTCRVYKGWGSISETDPEIKSTVLKYLRKKKLEEINGNN